MPSMQDYEIEVELTVTVRNKSTHREGAPELVASYTTATAESADSYSVGQSIPAAVTRCVDELHRKVAAVARLTQDDETRRLAKK